MPLLKRSKAASLSSHFSKSVLGTSDRSSLSSHSTRSGFTASTSSSEDFVHAATDRKNSGLPSSLKIKTQQQSPLTSSERSSRGKTVSFDRIDFHFHARTLGDQLGATGGPPISISWERIGSESISLDHYEATKPAPRCKNELILSQAYRMELLQDMDISLRQIRFAEAECLRYNELRRLNKRKSRRNNRRWSGLER